MTIINTNARSLSPKIDSLLVCLTELKSSIAVVSETWLKDCPELEKDVEDLEEGSGYTMLYKNREPNDRGFSHGGIAILSRLSVCKFSAIKMPNPDSFEVLPAVGTVKGPSRKLIVVAAYIPPNYNVPRAKKCLDYITDLVIMIKNKYRDPFIVVAGDFNQWAVDQAFY